MSLFYLLEDTADKGVIRKKSTPTLKMLFSSEYPIKPNIKQTQLLHRVVVMFENRGEHPEAFNSPLLGVNKISFSASDANMFFDIFEVDPIEFKRTIAKCPNIDMKWNVGANNFNLFVTWLSHCYAISTLPQNVIKSAITDLYKILQYKFFTGAVNNSYPYGAKIGVMQATIDQMNAKFDLKNPATNTWKKIIEVRASTMLDQSSIYADTIRTYNDDNMIVRICTDLQTSLRTKIVRVNVLYYKNDKAGVTMESSSMVGSDPEGEKEVAAIKATLDTTCNHIANNALNLKSFVRQDYLQMACAMSGTFLKSKPYILKEMLTKFSEIATMQFKEQTQYQRQNIKGKPGYILGYHTLITEIIQKTYRKCILSGIELKDRLQILKRTHDMYSASMISDPDILLIKDSVEHFIISNNIQRREGTVSSLKKAFILYIILLSFER